MVDAAIPEVRDAPDEAAVVLDVERAADVAEAADRLGGVELPRVMAEVAVGQRADRADGDAHAAVGAGRVGQIDAIGGRDAGFQRAAGDLDRGDADHLVADARAAVHR